MTVGDVRDIVGANEECIIAELEQNSEEQRPEVARTSAEIEAAIGLVMLSGEPVILPKRARTPPMDLRTHGRGSQHIRASVLLANCRDLVKEILAKNGYPDYPNTSKSNK